MCEGGWRETMVGTIGFYDAVGERQQTIYLGATPEYGKATFLGRMEREIARVKASHPGARYVGLADGAKGNWEFLGRHTEVQVIDFWHAAEYLSDAGDALFSGSTGAKKPWLEASCHRLKHEEGAARQLIRDLKRLAAEKGVSPSQLALAWLLHRSPVILPIPGTSSVEHLEDNVAAAGVSLTDDEMAALTDAAR